MISHVVLGSDDEKAAEKSLFNVFQPVRPEFSANALSQISTRQFQEYIFHPFYQPSFLCSTTDGYKFLGVTSVLFFVRLKKVFFFPSQLAQIGISDTDP